MDIHMLHFIQELLFRTSLNITAWSGALEALLAQQNLRLKGKDVFHRKMSKALTYYSILAAETAHHVRGVMLAVRPLRGAPEESEVKKDDNKEGWDDVPDMEHLCRCCPLCFGEATLWHGLGLVALSFALTLALRRSAGSLPGALVASGARTGTTTCPALKEDVIEPGMKVLDRSCHKWGILNEFSDQICWGISIFHTYGHQWPCQLIYYPRKCAGFGLSDGEGWIDMQVQFLQAQSHKQLGKWILCKAEACQEKLSGGLDVINMSPYTEDLLHTEWESQIKVQTWPIITATVGLAKKSIKTILNLIEYGKSLSKEGKHVDQLLGLAVGGKGGDVDELLAEKLDLVTKKEGLDRQIQQKRDELGVSETANLKVLMDNKYL
ncbi:hypothetical protein DFP72DRAFT_858142 [Ephemerocybe angulata]|uniref:Uncharacterized protein n=1 Tax=Ephemerocybe angulata TaxID=980116 RepID=A0A8H6HD81_9AGAR|nr:hypothetical protein DFP72DRAFT_858142 [Tulosesus angulatus]